MALADYKKCAVCQGKAIYDGDGALEARSQGDVWIEVICEDCSKLHSVLVVPNATLTDLMLRLRGGDEPDRSVAWGALWQLLRPAVPAEPGEALPTACPRCCADRIERGTAAPGEPCPSCSRYPAEPGEERT